MNVRLHATDREPQKQQCSTEDRKKTKNKKNEGGERERERERGRKKKQQRCCQYPCRKFITWNMPDGPCEWTMLYAVKEGKRTTFAPANMTQRKIPSYPKNQTTRLTWMHAHNMPLSQASARRSLCSACLLQRSTAAEWPLRLTPQPGFRWFTPPCSPAQSPHSNLHMPAASPHGDTGRVTAEVRAQKGQQSKKIAKSFLGW